MAKITVAQFCGMLDSAAAKRALGDTVTEPRTRTMGRSPHFLIYTCDYPGSSLSVELATADRFGDEKRSDRQVLDHRFTDSVKSEDAPVAYDDVPGLGVLAGYGPDPVSSTVINSHNLVVVFRAGAERLCLTVWVLGDVELDKLKPVAADLVKKVQAAIG